eukprot:3424836-Rhodomonas_salina.1
MPHTMLCTCNTHDTTHNAAHYAILLTQAVTVHVYSHTSQHRQSSFDSSSSVSTSTSLCLPFAGKGLDGRTQGCSRTPTWGQTTAINTAADKIANGSLPVPIKKA